MNVRGCMPIRLYLQKQVEGWIGPTGCSLPSSEVLCNLERNTVQCYISPCRVITRAWEICFLYLTCSTTLFSVQNKLPVLSEDQRNYVNMGACLRAFYARDGEESHHSAPELLWSGFLHCVPRTSELGIRPLGLRIRLCLLIKCHSVDSRRASPESHFILTTSATGRYF